MNLRFFLKPEITRNTEFISSNHLKETLLAWLLSYISALFIFVGSFSHFDCISSSEEDIASVKQVYVDALKKLYKETKPKGYAKEIEII
mgnify:CR=1 FL=1